MRERVEETKRSSPGARLRRTASMRSWNRAKRPGLAKSSPGISSGSTPSIGYADLFIAEGLIECAQAKATDRFAFRLGDHICAQDKVTPTAREPSRLPETP